MNLFGKAKITEIEAAGQFVIYIMKNVQQRWGDIFNDLKELLDNDNRLSDTKYPDFEFALAVIADQIQSLPNLLPEDQAKRVSEYIIKCISSPDLGDYPSDTIKEYQSAWDQSLKVGEPPFYGIASVFYDKLGFKRKVKSGDNIYKSPMLLMVLAEKIVTFGGPWWKDFIQKYKMIR